MNSPSTEKQPTFADGYLAGREAERLQAKETITKLQSALNKALSENLRLREAAKR